MKTINKLLIISSFTVILLSGLNACAKDTGDIYPVSRETIIDVEPDGTTLINSWLKSALSDDLAFDESELDILVHMKEEEKLARDVYTQLYAKWGIPVFSNISRAENTHMSAVIYLLKNYGEEYTLTGEPGVFSNPVLQQLYASLVAKGSESLEQALTTGALIEDLDINDLTEYLKVVSNENIIMVFENLARGSRNHIRSFSRLLTRSGKTYVPSYISKAYYDQIISSLHETGSVYPAGGRCIAQPGN